MHNLTVIIYTFNEANFNDMLKLIISFVVYAETEPTLNRQRRVYRHRDIASSYLD